MAELAYVATSVGLSGAVVPASMPVPYTGVRAVGLTSGPGRDWRFFGNTAGTIRDNNRVFFKSSPSSPEVPYAGARVRLHRLSDGYCAWEGVSDSAGYYWPRGLEVGLEYYPVAIDLTRMHECDAAGPVVAVEVS